MVCSVHINLLEFSNSCILRKSFKIKETCNAEENMGLISFFKKLLNEGQVEESTKLPRKIAFNEVQDWINNKEEEIKTREKKLLSLISDKVLFEIKNLEMQLEILERFDFERRKDKEKIELIVRENWKNYVDYVRKFISNFKELQESNFEKFIIKSNEIFVNFSKKSHMSYEKATFLIGKEMADVKNSIIDLSKYFKNVFKENKDIIDYSKKIFSVKSRLDQFNGINKNIIKIDEKISIMGDKIIEVKEKDKKFLEEVEKVSKNPDHLDNLSKKNKITSDKSDLDKEIYKLKEMIDFKRLKNIFHGIEKKSEIVNSYKENFQKSFYKDNGENILSLISEANLNNELISEKIKKLNHKKDEIEILESLIKEDATAHLFDKIEKIKIEIHNLTHEKEEETKMKEKLSLRKKEIINLIREEMNNFNINVED